MKMILGRRLPGRCGKHGRSHTLNAGDDDDDDDGVNNDNDNNNHDDDDGDNHVVWMS